MLHNFWFRFHFMVPPGTLCTYKHVIVISGRNASPSPFYVNINCSDKAWGSIDSYQCATCIIHSFYRVCNHLDGKEGSFLLNLKNQTSIHDSFTIAPVGNFFPNILHIFWADKGLEHFVNKNIITKHNFTRGSDSESLVCYFNVYEIPVSKKIRFNLTAIILFIMDQPFQHDILG